MNPDLRHLVEGFLLLVAAILPIVNPWGGAPMFLAMTADVTPEVRATLAKKIAINAFVLLLASLFVGTYVLEFFGLSVPIVRVPAVLVFIDAGSHVADAEADDDAEAEAVSSTGAPQAASAVTADPARATANRRTGRLGDDMRDPSISGPWGGKRGPLRQSM